MIKVDILTCIECEFVIWVKLFSAFTLNHIVCCTWFFQQPCLAGALSAPPLKDAQLVGQGKCVSNPFVSNRSVFCFNLIVFICCLKELLRLFPWIWCTSSYLVF